MASAFTQFEHEGWERVAANTIPFEFDPAIYFAAARINTQLDRIPSGNASRRSTESVPKQSLHVVSGKVPRARVQ